MNYLHRSASQARFTKLYYKKLCWNMIATKKNAEQLIILHSILWTIADLESHLLPWILGAAVTSPNDQPRGSAVFLAVQFGKSPMSTVVRGGSCYVGCFQEADENTLLCDHSWERNQGLKRSNPKESIIQCLHSANYSIWGYLLTVSVTNSPGALFSSRKGTACLHYFSSC